MQGGIVKVDDAGVTLAARTIPWPASISPEALAGLKAAAAQPSPPTPEPLDADAWRAMIVAFNAAMAESFAMPIDPSIAVTTEVLAGVTVHRARPRTLPAGDQRLYIEIHGGALVFGGGEFCRACGARDALQFGVEAVAVDYRVPPDHPFPAALDDCLAVYAAEVATRGAHNIIVGGGSAGGNLAAALMLRARDEGLPMPAALLLQTPEVDLTDSGDSFHTLLDLDPVLKAAPRAAADLYRGDWPADHPLVSPLFGDLAGFPPTLLQSGTRDLFLSNTVRMHRKLRAAGVAAELHVFEAMPHGGFFAGGPEDADLAGELARFVAAHWQRG